MPSTLYGQFCPIAMSLELIAGRWTLLIVRELLDGSTRFNDIHRGVPLVSRSLLSARLKELEAARLVERAHSARSGRSEYRLTEAGRGIAEVIKSLGLWGQEWLDVAMALDEIDGGYLMWNVKKRATWVPEMGEHTTVRFEFTDQPDTEKRLHWMVYEPSDIDLCFSDPGFEVDVWIETDTRSFTEVWMGWAPIGPALEDNRIAIDGPPELQRDPLRWIGTSILAGAKKRPPEQRIGRLIEGIRM